MRVVAKSQNLQNASVRWETNQPGCRSPTVITSTHSSPPPAPRGSLTPFLRRISHRARRTKGGMLSSPSLVAKLKTKLIRIPRRNLVVFYCFYPHWHLCILFHWYIWILSRDNTISGSVLKYKTRQPSQAFVSSLVIYGTLTFLRVFRDKVSWGSNSTLKGY